MHKRVQNWCHLLVSLTVHGQHAPLSNTAKNFRSVFSMAVGRMFLEQRALKQTWKLLCLWVAWSCQWRDALLIKSRLSSFLLAWNSAHKVLFSKPVIELVCQVPFPFKLAGRIAKVIQIQAIPELSQSFLKVWCFADKVLSISETGLVLFCFGGVFFGVLFLFSILLMWCLGEVAVLQLMENFVLVSVLETDSALVLNILRWLSERVLCALSKYACEWGNLLDQKLRVKYSGADFLPCLKVVVLRN